MKKEIEFPPMQVTVEEGYVDIRFEKDNDVWTPLTFRIIPFENRAIIIKRIEDRKMHDSLLMDVGDNTITIY